MKLSFRTITSRIPKRLKSKKALAIIVLLLVLWSFLNRGAADTTLITTTTAERKALEVQVTASGTVRSASQTVMRFPGGGRIAYLGVSEGQHIEKGTAIASLDSRELAAAVRQAQQDVVAADAVLEQVYDDAKKYPPPENYDNKIKRTNAERAKNQAWDALIAAKATLGHSTIFAPFSGTVITAPVVSGQVVGPTTDVSEIADLGSMEFVAEVDETEIGKIIEGQETKITLDAFPDTEFDATVSKISSKSTVATTGATAYDVTFSLPQAQNFRLGMSGEAEILTDRSEETVVLPLEAIIDDKYVWVLENGEYTKKEIEKGLESDTEVEIKNNVSEGNVVVTGGVAEIGKKSLLQKILGKK